MHDSTVAVALKRAQEAVQAEARTATVTARWNARCSHLDSWVARPTFVLLRSRRPQLAWSELQLVEPKLILLKVVVSVVVRVLVARVPDILHRPELPEQPRQILQC